MMSQVFTISRLAICRNSVVKYKYQPFKTPANALFSAFYFSRLFIVGIVDISVFISLRFSSLPVFSTSHIVTSFPQSSINLHKFMKIGSKMVRDWFKSSVAFHHYLLLYIISYFFSCHFLNFFNRQFRTFRYFFIR